MRWQAKDKGEDTIRHRKSIKSDLSYEVGEAIAE